MSRYLTFVLGLALFTLSFTSFAKPAKLSVEDFIKITLACQKEKK